MHRCALVFLLLISLAGCDGVYIYQYDGQLCTKAGMPIEGRWLAVDNAVQAPPPNDVPGPSHGSLNTRVETNAHGQFRGAFTLSTGWAFAFRPSAPKLGSLRLLQFDGSTWHSSTLPLTASNQTSTEGCAVIHLGIIRADSYPR